MLGLNEASISHFSPTMPRDRWRREGRKIVGVRGDRWLHANSVSWTHGHWHVWIHSYCDSRHKTCTRSSPTKFWFQIMLTIHLFFNSSRTSPTCDPCFSTWNKIFLCVFSCKLTEAQRCSSRLCWSTLCCCNKMPEQNSSKGKLFVLVPDFRGFSPDSLAVGSGSTVEQAMVK